MSSSRYTRSSRNKKVLLPSTLNFELAQRASSGDIDRKNNRGGVDNGQGGRSRSSRSIRSAANIGQSKRTLWRDAVGLNKLHIGGRTNVADDLDRDCRSQIGDNFLSKASTIVSNSGSHRDHQLQVPHWSSLSGGTSAHNEKSQSRNRASIGSTTSKNTGITTGTNGSGQTQDSDIPNSNKVEHFNIIKETMYTSTGYEIKIEEFRRLLARRSPHIPGNGCVADWVQYMRNNHPLLGICCKYKENPIVMPQRLLMLLGSIFLGFAVTNYVYIYFKLNHGENDVVLFKMDFGGPSHEVTYESLILWTLGAAVHSIVDLSIWHLATCAPCLPGGCCSCLGFMVNVGRYIYVSLCILFAMCGTLGIFMRTNYEAAAAGEGDLSIKDLTKLDISNVNAPTFSFWVGYCVELILVYFLYYPIIATLLFAGCIPFVGGRQRELERQEQENEEGNQESTILY